MLHGDARSVEEVEEAEEEAGAEALWLSRSWKRPPLAMQSSSTEAVAMVSATGHACSLTNRANRPPDMLLTAVGASHGLGVARC